MATVESEGRGLVAEVQRDHREIERMLERVDRTTGTERRDAFEELARKLVVHETAEELLVHPLLQHTDAEPVADEMLEQEHEVKRSLSELDGIDVTSDDFERRYMRLRGDVLSHARQEESDEHPLVAAAESPEHLDDLGGIFELADRAATMRPHSDAPGASPVILALGPALSVSDRVKESLERALDRP